jgi:hypothetical protein
MAAGAIGTGGKVDAHRLHKPHEKRGTRPARDINHATSRDVVSARMMIEANHAIRALTEPRCDHLELRPRARVDHDHKIKLTFGKLRRTRIHVRNFRRTLKRAEISLARIDDPTFGMHSRRCARTHHREYRAHGVAVWLLVGGYEHALCFTEFTRERIDGGVCGVGH